MTHTLPTAVIVELPEGADNMRVTKYAGHRFLCADPKIRIALPPEYTYTHAKLLKDVSEEEASGMVCSIDELTGTPDTTFRAILKNHIRHLGYKNAAVVFKEK